MKKATLLILAGLLLAGTSPAASTDSQTLHDRNVAWFVDELEKDGLTGFDPNAPFTPGDGSPQEMVATAVYLADVAGIELGPNAATIPTAAGSGTFPLIGEGIEYNVDYVFGEGTQQRCSQIDHANQQDEPSGYGWARYVGTLANSMSAQGGMLNLALVQDGHGLTDDRVEGYAGTTTLFGNFDSICNESQSPGFSWTINLTLYRGVIMLA